MSVFTGYSNKSKKPQNNEKNLSENENNTQGEVEKETQFVITVEGFQSF